MKPSALARSYFTQPPRPWWMRGDHSHEIDVEQSEQVRVSGIGPVSVIAIRCRG